MKPKPLVNETYNRTVPIKRLLLLLLVGTVFFQCDPSGDSRLWIINPTSDSLYYYHTFDRHKLPVSTPFRPYDEKNLLPKEKINLKLGTGKWEEFIFNDSSDSSMLFYIFQNKIIKTTSWEAIRRNKLYKVYKVKLKDLEQNNWRVRLDNSYIID
jgi:hypothetical protein